MLSPFMAPAGPGKKKYSKQSNESADSLDEYYSGSKTGIDLKKSQNEDKDWPAMRSVAYEPT